MTPPKSKQPAAPKVSTTQKPLLELTNVSKHYSNGENIVRALDDVSLAIYPGEFVAIMGQSGSGKSTMMNIIGCLDQPSEGNFVINGREVSALEADELAALRRETFGFVFQRYNLLATATAEENVEIPAVYAGFSKAARTARSKELLAKLGLGERGGHRPSELSGGQQQRVAIARALMNDPPVILADEPTGALDSKSGVEVMNLLKALHAEGRTIILITHDEKVAKNAERIISLHDGKIVKPITSPKPHDTDKLTGTQSEKESLLLPDIAEATKMAMRSLRVNIFRTSLTLLGIVIGVAAVITMLAVGNGSKQKILDQITAMGTNLLAVRPGAAGIRSSGDIVTLTMDDASAILTIPNVEMIIPERSGRFTLRHGNMDYATSVQGTGPDMPAVKDWALQEGSFFNDRDMKGNVPVIVLGQTVIKNLFPNDDNPVGEYVLVKNVPFEIIGTLTAKGASAFGSDQDDAAFVPVTTGMIRLYGKTYLNSITVRIADLKKIDQTQDEITELLKKRHHAEDFNIRNMTSILDTATQTQDTLTYMLGAVAAISLLVGGIGVMNIMLVSVTERTREIGIRMATGARRRDIMLQFNTEAAVVCGVGGVLGIILGVAVGLILEAFGANVMFSIMPAVLAFTCAFGTGLLFGYLPARKAAYLDPVIALASE